MTEEYHRSMVFSIHRFIMRLQRIEGRTVPENDLKGPCMMVFHHARALFSFVIFGLRCGCAATDS